MMIVQPLTGYYVNLSNHRRRCFAFLKRTNSESGMRVLLGFTVIPFLVRIIQLNPMLLSNPCDFNKTKDEDIKLKTFFQSLLKLYSAKSMLADIYIRSRLRRISYEMIFSIIPVLVFIVKVGNITSPTQEYNHAVLRITYSIALASDYIRTYPTLSNADSYDIFSFKYKCLDNILATISSITAIIINTFTTLRLTVLI
jgi:hypothetical protein